MKLFRDWQLSKFKWVVMEGPMPKKHKNCQGPDGCSCWKKKVLGGH